MVSVLRVAHASDREPPRLAALARHGSARPVRARPEIAKAIEHGVCIGCGACAAAHPAFRVREAANGELRVLEAPKDPAALEAGSRVCPFAEAPDEDALADAFLSTAPHRHPSVGRYIDIYAGWSPAHRAQAGSGGLTRWLVAELLRTGEVDFVVHVSGKTENAPGAPLFAYGLHRTAEAFLGRTSTSAYHPVTLQTVLDEMMRTPGRGLVTALPCFARALRALSLERPEIRDKVRFISGTICGSLKSRRYAEYLAGQLGVPAGELDRVNFRGKSLSRVASDKCVEVWRRDSPEERPDGVARMQDLDGARYDMGYFKYTACDYCDDVLAETADVAFGDAWLRPWREDPRGANLVVVRHPVLAQLLRRAAERGEIHLDPITAGQAAQSQGGGLRHRRDGLAVRLWLNRRLGRWTPRKRAQPAWRGAEAAVVQLQRVAVRKVTSLGFLSPESPAFRPAVGVVLFAGRKLEGLHRRVRRLRRRPGAPPGTRPDRPA